MEIFLKEKQEEMLQLLEKLVNIDSGSYYKEGIDQVGTILAKEYELLGFNIEVQEQKDHGNNLLIRHKDATNPEIVIVAHMDTVFPEGTVKERPFRRDEKRAYGPGVIDMKASQVSVLYVMKALLKANEDAYKNVQIILNSDEEIGSPTSRELIEEVAKTKKYSLIVEPARADGSIVSQRKGGGRYTITVHGKGAHSGVEPQKGHSAIDELAHKVIKLHSLTNYDEGLTVNVGQVEGGTSCNTVAPLAVGNVDVRVVNEEQAVWADEQIREICSSPDVEGTSIELEGDISRPPMFLEDNAKKLLDIIVAVGKDLGMNIKHTSTGGGSDGNFTAAMGVATIDGLGPVGGNAHSEEEYLEIDSLVERTLLLANVIVRLSH